MGDLSRSLAALAVAAALALSCGRFGFDSTASDDDGGDADGAGDGAGDDGSGLVDAAVGEGDGGAGVAGCFAVTTGSDEEDGGESARPPHLGSGLSLREAIHLANQASGADCIIFAQTMTIAVVGADLPEAADAAGLSIDGGSGASGAGAVQIIGAGAATATAGLRLALGPAQIRNLDLTGFGTCLAVGASASAIGPGLDVHGCGAGVQVTAADVRLRGVLAHDNTGHGIHITAPAARADLFQLVVHDNGGDGIRARATTGLRARHVTVAVNAGAGIDAREGATAVTVLNAILGRNAGPGVAVDGQASLDALEYCDFFEDTCEGCAIGAGSITSNPRFTNLTGRNLTLKAGSPCADRGTDTGLDTNGDERGLFGGGAPDLGAFESN